MKIRTLRFFIALYIKEIHFDKIRKIRTFAHYLQKMQLFDILLWH